MNQKELSEIKTIGVIGWGLMGDVLMRTPVLRALREIFPNARIVVSVDPVGEEVLRYNPDIDNILVFDRKKRPKWKYIFNKLKGWKDIKAENFDLMIDLYSGSSSSMLIRLSGVKRKIGFRHLQLKSNIYDILIPNEFETASTPHLSKQLLKIISIFEKNFEEYSVKPIFITHTMTDKKMKQYRDSFSLDKTYLLNFGSGGIEKILSSDKSFEQVKFLYDTYGYSPLVICNPGQEVLQKNFVEKYLTPASIPYAALNVLSLEEIGSLMKLNDFIITPDTGLYHIAVAIGIPIIGIFTYTNPLLVEPESGLFIHCFQPDPKTVDNPMSFGKKDLDLDYLIGCTEQLVKQVLETNR